MKQSLFALLLLFFCFAVFLFFCSSSLLSSAMRREVERIISSLIETCDNTELLLVVHDLYENIRLSKLPNANNLKYLLRPGSAHLQILLYIVQEGPTLRQAIPMPEGKAQPHRAFKMALDLLVRNGLILEYEGTCEITAEGRNILNIIGNTIRTNQK